MGMLKLQHKEGFHVSLHSRWCVENRLTVTVLASISVNMNSPPSKSPFKYKSALGKRMRGSERTRNKSRISRQAARLLLGAPVVSVGVGWRLLPALVGLRVQKTVVGVDGVTQVVPVVLLAC